MSHRIRQALPLVALAITLVFAFQRVNAPAGEPQPDRPFDAFPAAVTATASPLPQYADGPQMRIEQQLASIDAMWSAAFTAAGDRYERPRLAGSVAEGCRPTGEWAGLYCGDGAIIVIDVAAHLQRNVAVGGGLSDLALAYIVAHEAGHHVQSLRGAPDVVLRRELHADCLAGVWGKAAGQPLPPTWLYGEDAEHGTKTQRIQWLNRGYAHARPADCDAVWRAETL